MITAAEILAFVQAAADRFTEQSAAHRERCDEWLTASDGTTHAAACAGFENGAARSWNEAAAHLRSILVAATGASSETQPI